MLRSGSSWWGELWINSPITSGTVLIILGYKDVLKKKKSRTKKPNLSNVRDLLVYEEGKIQQKYSKIIQFLLEMKEKETQQGIYIMDNTYELSNISVSDNVC